MNGSTKGASPFVIAEVCYNHDNMHWVRVMSFHPPPSQQAAASSIQAGVQPFDYWVDVLGHGEPKQQEGDGDNWDDLPTKYQQMFFADSSHL